MAADRVRVYDARVIVTSMCGSLQGQSLWCKGYCKGFLWQLTWTGFMVQG